MCVVERNRRARNSRLRIGPLLRSSDLRDQRHRRNRVGVLEADGRLRRLPNGVRELQRQQRGQRCRQRGFLLEPVSAGVGEGQQVSRLVRKLRGGRDVGFVARAKRQRGGIEVLVEGAILVQV